MRSGGGLRERKGRSQVVPTQKGFERRPESLAASIFAGSFYQNLLAGKPLGTAVRLARSACRDAFPLDLAWASYVLYGDPRLFFRAEETT